MVQSYVGHCVGAFRPSRCLWGSDWPVSLHINKTGLAKNIQIFKTALKKLNLSQTEIDDIFTKNAKKVYQIE